MKNIYLISGLGADYRAFQFLDLSEYHAVYIEWIKPELNETIQHYASRLTSQIKDVKPILIGLSFGGMIAVEIGKLMDTEKIILISSAQNRMDLPFYYRWAGKTGLHKIIPFTSLKKTNPLVNWVFGIRSDQDKHILQLYLNEMDEAFLRWAIGAIVKWDNMVSLNNVTRIHGTADRILPITTPNFRIKGGGHFMIINRHKEISQVLKKLL